MEDEAETVRAFIEPSRRDRWLSGLSSAKRRGKTVDRLHHSSDLDERYMRPASGRSVEAVRDELVRLGAPNRCHVIGGALDGEDHDLTHALDQALESFGGVLISCVPGSLAVYLPEAPSEFVILIRPS